MPFSAHCAPSLHAHPSCALTAFRHLEYFHDHARIEQMFFEGALSPAGGALRPDPARPGFGLEFKRKDVARYAL
jgi:Enolase C-terminal domain-like